MKRKQGTTLLTERNHKEALRCYLPYIIGEDYKRLVRLSRIWQRRAQKKHYGPSYNALSAQCESLYYRVYGSVCYFGNVPQEAFPER